MKVPLIDVIFIAVATIAITHIFQFIIIAEMITK